MRFVKFTILRWGRGATLALFVASLSTFVMLAVLLLVGLDKIPGEVVGEVAWAYFVTMAAVGGASQLPNVAERLPGERRWHSPPGEHRSASQESLP